MLERQYSDSLITYLISSAVTPEKFGALAVSRTVSCKDTDIPAVEEAKKPGQGCDWRSRGNKMVLLPVSTTQMLGLYTSIGGDLDSRAQPSSSCSTLAARGRSASLGTGRPGTVPDRQLRRSRKVSDALQLYNRLAMFRSLRAIQLEQLDVTSKGWFHRQPQLQCDDGCF